MSNYRKPVEEAINIFLKIKGALDTLETKVEEPKKLDQLKQYLDKLKSKIRARAREVPEMIVELGLVPTLSFCLAKSEKEGLGEIIALLEKNDGKAMWQILNKIIGGKDLDKYAYAIYTYVLLKFLSNYLGSLKYREDSQERDVKLDLANLDKNESAWNDLYKYLEALMQGGGNILATRLLQPYLLQFKRLCEAEFKSESRG